MRFAPAVLIVTGFATSAAAAPPARAPEQIQIPPQLTDPATADRLADMMQALSKTFLNLPAGELQAAAEGRRATARERRMTVGDLGRRDDPNFDRNFEQQIANARPMIQQSMQALAKSLPAMDRALSQMAAQMQQVAETLPAPH